MPRTVSKSKVKKSLNRFWLPLPEIWCLIVSSASDQGLIVTDNFKFNAELGAAERAARDAGVAVMGLFRGKFDVHEKSKNNPVTSADLEANRIIRECVQKRLEIEDA